MIMKMFESYFRRKADEYYRFAVFYYFNFAKWSVADRKGNLCHALADFYDSVADVFERQDGTPSSA